MRLLLILIVGYSAALQAQVPSEERLQKLYYQAVENEDSTELLLKKTEFVNSSSSGILQGYKAMANMLTAQYAWFPTTKLDYFNKGKDLLNTAIKADSNNVELRFFRYSSQMEAPSLLNYNNHIKADKSFIIKHYATLSNPFVKKKIRDYMLWKCKCTEAEKKVFY